MTACVNSNQKREGARRAVGATLAGVLAVGMVPAAAFADEVAEAAEDEGIELAWQSSTGAFENYTSINVKLLQGGDTTAEGVFKVGNVPAVKYVQNTPVNVEVQYITLAGGYVIETVDASASTGISYTMDYYYRNADGTAGEKCANNEAVNAGEYYAVLTATSGSYAGAKAYFAFSIAPRDVTAEVVGEVVDGDVVNGSTVTYNGLSREFDFKFTDVLKNAEVPLDEGVDYEVYYVPADGGATEAYKTDVKDAGTYRAVVTFTSSNYRLSTELSDLIQVEKLDLGEVTVEAMYTTDAVVPSVDAVWVDGRRITSGDLMNLKVSVGDNTVLRNGTYQASIAPEKGNQDKNVYGASSATVYKVDQIATFEYDGEAWPASYEYVASDSKSQKLDSNNVTAVSADRRVSLAWSKDEVARYDVYKDGVLQDNGTWPTTPGTYTVVYYTTDAGATAAQNAYKIGGKAVMEYTVYADAINADATAYVNFDADGDGMKEVVDSVNVTYGDYENLAKEVTATVTTSDGKILLPEKEFKTKFYDVAGNEVRTIKNAGAYTMKITSDKYKLSGTTEVTLTVGKLSLADVKIGALQTRTFDNAKTSVKYLPYLLDMTGKWSGANGDGKLDTYTPSKADGNGYDLVELAIQYKKGKDYLPMRLPDVTVTMKDSKGNEVDRLADEGAYTIEFTARNTDAAGNYEFPDAVTVEVIKDGRELERDADGDTTGNIIPSAKVADHLKFADVPYTKWSVDVVDAVTDDSHKFMNGVSGTNLFKPDDAITRGQIACVLFNIATYESRVDETKLMYNEVFGYSSFDDVNGKEYYGKAIAWAKLAGVINGYGDGTFRADQPVTREEFAAMLANYVKAFGQYEGAEDVEAALATMPDGGAVTGWARDVVAWAVENGVMGNGGLINPLGDITRDEAAAMVYNYFLA